jgi:hypothetical protein
MWRLHLRASLKCGAVGSENGNPGIAVYHSTGKPARVSVLDLVIVNDANRLWNVIAVFINSSPLAHMGNPEKEKSLSTVTGSK